MIPHSSTASPPIFRPAAGVRERENHAADDSEGGALDMCCSERLPGESSQPPGAPRALNGGREPPQALGLEESLGDCESTQ